VGNLNELEFINGEIWANVWQTDFIVRISPESGIVTGLIDLSGLAQRTARDGAEAVLNGIAYDEENARLFVTGKYWATLYEIELIEQ
jgi:glutamine cyclotransferase